MNTKQVADQNAKRIWGCYSSAWRKGNKTPTAIFLKSMNVLNMWSGMYKRLRGLYMIRQDWKKVGRVEERRCNNVRCVGRVVKYDVESRQNAEKVGVWW